MDRPIFIVDIIGDIVSKIQTAILTQLQAKDMGIVNINYMYGQPKEISERLTQMTHNDVTSAEKYPLVALFLPIVETHGQDVGIDDLSPIKIIIARWSNKEDNTATRYDNNFRPFLYPIYLSLLDQMDNDKRLLFEDSALIDHTKTDWPYYGGDSPPEQANPFNDYVDAIELKIKLKILTSNC